VSFKNLFLWLAVDGGNLFGGKLTPESKEVNGCMRGF